MYHFHGHQRFATAEHPPLYPALLAAVAWLGPGSVLALQMTSAVVGAAGVTVIGLLGGAWVDHASGSLPRSCARWRRTCGSTTRCCSRRASWR